MALMSSDYSDRLPRKILKLAVIEDNKGKLLADSSPVKT
jgi:hypothetical protein